MDRLSKVFLVLAAAGVVVALYHSYDEITSYTAPLSTVCNVNALFSCGSVFASGDVNFPPGANGIPLYVYGLIWFPLMVALGLWFGARKSSLGSEVLFALLMVGNAFTVYLWYQELEVIHALCPVCISMYLLNYGMTLVAGRAFIGSLRS